MGRQRNASGRNLNIHSIMRLHVSDVQLSDVNRQKRPYSRYSKRVAVFCMNAVEKHRYNASVLVILSVLFNFTVTLFY